MRAENPEIENILSSIEAGSGIIFSCTLGCTYDAFGKIC